MKKKLQKKWTDQELAIVRQWFPLEGSPGALKQLEKAGYTRSRRSVYSSAYALGLKSPLFGQPNSGWFKKGMVSQTKGYKMTAAQKEKFAHTWFKKGERPHNTLYDFAVVQSRNKVEKGQFAWQIRIGLKKWIMLNTFAWRELYGNIPPHHVVTMDPGFDELCHRFFPAKTPKQEPDGHWENICAFVRAAKPYLGLITKAENAQRNSGSENLSFNYVAGKLSKGNPNLRNIIKEQAPQLVLVEQQRLLNNRLIKQITNER